MIKISYSLKQWLSFIVRVYMVVKLGSIMLNLILDNAQVFIAAAYIQIIVNTMPGVLPFVACIVIERLAVWQSESSQSF